MMRRPPSICSPRSRALSCASPLTPPMNTVAVYETAGARGATVVIPPAKTATVSGHGPRSPARDRTITWVKTLGRRQWKKASGYHRQGRVENTFFRYKSIIGDSLCAPGGNFPFPGQRNGIKLHQKNAIIAAGNSTLTLVGHENI